MSESDLAARLEDRIHAIPDFPEPGILFRDITPVLAEGPLFAELVAHLTDRVADADVDAIVGIESRGFIFGAPMATRLQCGFVPIRKPGKLPREVAGIDYELEYGTDRLEVHTDAIPPGARVVLVDDLLATGGTAAASIELLEGLGAEIVEVQMVIELLFLDGAARLGEHPLYSVVEY
jgi:adenine phosphoribosyltransferase